MMMMEIPTTIPVTTTAAAPRPITIVADDKQQQLLLVLPTVVVVIPTTTSILEAAAATSSSNNNEDTAAAAATAPPPPCGSNSSAAAEPTLGTEREEGEIIEEEEEEEEEDVGDAVTTTVAADPSRNNSVVLIGDAGILDAEERAVMWDQYGRDSNLTMWLMQETTVNGASTSLFRMMRKRPEKETKLVIVSFSANACFGGYISKTVWKRLIENLRRTFPEADKILLGSVLFPFYGGYLKHSVALSNENLKKVVREARHQEKDKDVIIRFVNLTNITRRLKDKKPKRSMYRDALYPNTKCAKELADELFSWNVYYS